MKRQIGLKLWMFVGCLLHSAAIQAETKLQPLPYNNADLQVDLGVGLWAWPMPMDYDRDGDFDLLVACPDKPSNGVYFFENPSQDPNAALPVFRPAVRLGKALQNFQVSYVDGSPRILSTNQEFPFRSDGTFDFDHPVSIYPKSNIHQHAVRANMWRYVDFDSDGDQDLSVGVGDWSDYGWDHAFDTSGRWRNGPLHGYVYIILNEGDAAQAKYSEAPFQLHAGGRPIDVYGWPSPNFADFDADGDLDLLCGEFLDGFTYFENVGTKQKPEYSVGQRLLNSNEEPLVMNLQMITPTAFDWDRDGDYDLIVGDEDGRVAWIENTGRYHQRAPVFEAPKYFRQQADTLKFGALANPVAVDWDHDGDQDILCGNTAGNLGWFENLGFNDKNQLPVWSEPKLLQTKTPGKETLQTFRVTAGPNGSVQGPCEAKWGYTTPCVVDWDKDGDWDVLFNSILSRVEMLQQVNGAFQRVALDELPIESGPKWNWNRSQGAGQTTSWRTTPMAIDADRDGKLDLVSLDQEGFLTLRKSFGKAARFYVDTEGEPLQLNARSAGASGRVKFWMADWNADGLDDLLVNSDNAALYLNRGMHNDRIVLESIGNLGDRNISGHTTSPTTCDFDADGDLDLLIGAEDGRLYHMRHEDCLNAELPLRTTSPVQPAKPQVRFSGHVREEFLFDEAPFAECHASTICETSRGLCAAWFGGTKEGNSDVGIWCSFHDGQAWSEPREWANGVQHDSLRYPCWNPVLFQMPGDGPLMLFFKVGPSPSTWWGEAMISYDRGRTFRDRKRLPEGIDGPVRCKPILIGDGSTLLCGSSTEYDGWRVHLEKVPINGDVVPLAGWRRIGPINTSKEFNAIQPTFLTHPNGRIQVLCRSMEDVITSSYSNDQGETWSPMRALDLPNPNSGIDAVTLRDGRHLLIYNHLPAGETGWGKRGQLNLAISDDGETWAQVGVLELEENQEFSYPAMIEDQQGMVQITYTWKRKRIKHVTLDPSKLRTSP